MTVSISLYTMEDTTTNNVGETFYESCCAQLKMENQYDKVNIGGNFTTHNLCTSYGYYVRLTRGILSIGGNIWSDSGISADSSYGHKTVLTGDKK